MQPFNLALKRKTNLNSTEKTVTIEASPPNIRLTRFSSKFKTFSYIPTREEISFCSLSHIQRPERQEMILTKLMDKTNISPGNFFIFQSINTAVAIRVISGVEINIIRFIVRLLFSEN